MVRIGVSCVLDKEGRYCVHRAYLESILRAGAVPVVTALYSVKMEHFKSWLSELDGFLLTGGVDIDPIYYGEAKHNATVADPVRDGCEIPLCQVLYEMKIPTLGICRGIQVMAVALGGTLCQHVEGHSDGIIHRITLKKNRPECLLGMEKEQSVHSSHHQVVKKIPSCATTFAVAQDGCVEGIFCEEHPFYVGVQWHPERLDSTMSRTLFESLTEQARIRANEREVPSGARKS